MFALALKILIGNRASCIGMIFGVFLATLLISQQSAIFLGLASRSYRIVTDIPEPNLWVMDKATESDDKVRKMPLSYLDIIRSVTGIKWAVPIGHVMVQLVTQSGLFQICELYGVDDATLIGAPMQMIEGQVKDLRREGGVIVDVYSANTSFARKLPDGTKIPLRIGDEFEMNGKRAVVVGICKVTQGFFPQPIIFTAYSQFLRFDPSMANRLDFIAAKTDPNENIEDIQKRINAIDGFAAFTKDQFEWRIIEDFLKTGVLINFALSVALGIIIGFSIVGQTFYLMTLQNLPYYALVKSLGGTLKMIFQMIAVQVFTVGVIGFCLGIGTTVLWGMAIKDTTLAFLFNWQLLLFTWMIIVTVCAFAAILSMRKVYKTDPKTLTGN
ncbi:MAG: ABC transporter permease [Chlamydiales bacterium]|nr:ABC transporter permease [Chlamydiales bacterium]